MTTCSLERRPPFLRPSGRRTSRVGTRRTGYSGSSLRSWGPPARSRFSVFCARRQTPYYSPACVSKSWLGSASHSTVSPKSGEATRPGCRSRNSTRISCSARNREGSPGPSNVPSTSWAARRRWSSCRRFCWASRSRSSCPRQGRCCFGRRESANTGSPSPA